MTDTPLDAAALLEGTTPGEWLAGTGGSGGATTFVYESAHRKQKSAIAGCTLGYDDRPMSERIANARLIAAAPALARKVIALEVEVARLREAGSGLANEVKINKAGLTSALTKRELGFLMEALNLWNTAALKPQESSDGK